MPQWKAILTDIRTGEIDAILFAANERAVQGKVSSYATLNTAQFTIAVESPPIEQTKAPARKADKAKTFQEP